jgi:hypothetical protein
VDYRRRVPEDTPQQHVEPLDVDAVRTVQVGTGLWTAALIGCLVFRDQLEEADREWWLWVAVAGVVLGVLGIAITTRRRRRLARAHSSK